MARPFDLFVSTANRTCKISVAVVPSNVTNTLVLAYHLRTLKATTGRIQAKNKLNLVTHAKIIVASVSNSEDVSHQKPKAAA